MALADRPGDVSTVCVGAWRILRIPCEMPESWRRRTNVVPTVTETAVTEPLSEAAAIESSAPDDVGATVRISLARKRLRELRTAQPKVL
jgi:hypothetical protein